MFVSYLENLRVYMLHQFYQMLFLLLGHTIQFFFGPYILLLSVNFIEFCHAYIVLFFRINANFYDKFII